MKLRVGASTHLRWASTSCSLQVYAITALAFLGSCLIARGGFVSSADPGDVGRYHGFADLMRTGALPYRDFYFEYPPGAISAFLAPFAFGGLAGYNLAFKFSVAIIALALLAVVVALLGTLDADPWRRWNVLGLFVVTPVALGAVVLNRYDVLPTLLAALTLLALLRSRARIGFALLAVGCAVKIFPAVFLPVAAIHVYRTGGRRELVRASAVFTGVLLVFFAPFIVLAPGGVGYSFYTQIIRKLQIESLGASLLLGLDGAGIYTSRIIPGKPGSIDLDGLLPAGVGILTSALFLVVLAVIVFLYWRTSESQELLVAGFAASATAFVTLSKVISPQFLVWLVPLVPLVAGRKGRIATLLLLLVLVLTQVEVVYEHPLRAVGWPVWVLLVRNGLLVALLLVLLSALRDGGRPTGTMPSNAGV